MRCGFAAQPARGVNLPETFNPPLTASPNAASTCIGRRCRDPGGGMSRLGKGSFGRLLRGVGALLADAGMIMLKWLGLGSAVLAACIAADMAVTSLSLRECVLLAAAAILALTV